MSLVASTVWRRQEMGHIGASSCAGVATAGRRQAVGVSNQQVELGGGAKTWASASQLLVILVIDRLRQDDDAGAGQLFDQP